MVHDAFISYRRNGGFAFAKMLLELLKLRNVSAYVDLEELGSGVFDEKLITAIKETPAFILILPPGALDRCCEEGDWLTREIVAAIDADRNIIPVLCDGFTWPKKWPDNIPEKIHKLSTYNSVVMDFNYMNAVIDKLVTYIHGADAVTSATLKSEARDRDDIEDFFSNNMRNMENIQGVDLAFHAGSVWLQNVNRLDIITALAEAGIEIRVILNTPEIATLMGKHMRHKLKRYLPFDEAISLWKNIESMYENVKVMVTDIPMFRIQYTFRMKDSPNDVMRIKYYTHGVSQIDRNYIEEFTPADYQFKLYRNEFDYVWDYQNAKNK